MCVCVREREREREREGGRSCLAGVCPANARHTLRKRGQRLESAGRHIERAVSAARARVRHLGVDTFAARAELHPSTAVTSSGVLLGGKRNNQVRVLVPPAAVTLSDVELCEIKQGQQSVSRLRSIT